MATLDEVYRRWSLDDVLDAHAVLDAEDELKRREAERARREMGRR